MYIFRLFAGAAVLLAGLWSAEAGAVELKVLSVEAMRGALQELAPAFEADSKNKLKIEYVTADDIMKRIEDIDVAIVTKAGMDKLAALPPKIVSNSRKVLVPAKGDPAKEYLAASSFWTEEALAGKALIDFLAGPKAAEVYKAKGLVPG